MTMARASRVSSVSRASLATLVALLAALFTALVTTSVARAGDLQEYVRLKGYEGQAGDWRFMGATESECRLSLGCGRLFDLPSTIHDPRSLFQGLRRNVV